jgi:hypothetical protein
MLVNCIKKGKNFKVRRGVIKNDRRGRVIIFEMITDEVDDKNSAAAAMLVSASMFMSVYVYGCIWLGEEARLRLR